MPESGWSNQDGYRFRLELANDLAFRGEALVGHVRLQSISQDWVKVPRVGVWLWTGVADNDGNYVRPQIETAHNLDLAPMDTQELEFHLELARTALLGPVYLSATTGKALSALLGYPTLTVRILPEPRFVALAEELARVSGHTISHWTGVGGGDGVHAHLTPSPEVRSLFDGIGLVLYPDGSSVYGTLIVDPQERTLADLLRAATLADVRKYRIRFSANELSTAGAEFERLLRPFLAADRHLPIPAIGEQRDELPRASQPPAPDLEGLPLPEPSNPLAER